MLEKSVKLRFISDVPLGAFLSGGLDSSLVVSLMSKLMKEKIKTFSIGFQEAEFNELKYAKIVSEHLSTDHKEFVVTPDIKILPDLIYQLDEPFADPSIIPVYYVSKLARSKVTVALTGEGGDEIFAGYSRYFPWDQDKVSNLYKIVPFKNTLPRLTNNKELKRKINKLNALDKAKDDEKFFYKVCKYSEDELDELMPNNKTSINIIKKTFFSINCY